MAYKIKKIKDKPTLRKLLNTKYKADFPYAERMDNEYLYDIFEKGNLLVLGYYDKELVAYALCIKAPKVDSALYMAFISVDPNLRNQGIGSKFLKDIEKYVKKDIVLEIETPENNPLAKKRVNFYQKNDYAITKQGLNIWDVDYVFVYKSQKAFEEIFADYINILKFVNGTWFKRKVFIND